MTPTLVLDELFVLKDPCVLGHHTFCHDHFPRILAATSPASVTIDGVVKLRMEEEGMGARSPISCYSTIRFVIITMVIMMMVMFMLMMMEEEGMGAWSPISCFSTIRLVIIGMMTIQMKNMMMEERAWELAPPSSH